MKKKGKGRNLIKEENLQFIREAVEMRTISKSEIESLTRINYPIFSFRYFNDVSLKDCRDYRFFISYINRLHKLSELGWDEIRKSHRHAYGMEPMTRAQIRHSASLPDFVTREVDLDVFRAVGDNRVMVGLQEGKIFHVFFVESKFGDVSIH